MPEPTEDRFVFLRELRRPECFKRSPSRVKIEIWSDEEGLGGLLKAFERFIRACGYHPTGELMFVREEDDA